MALLRKYCFWMTRPPSKSLKGTFLTKKTEKSEREKMKRSLIGIFQMDQFCFPKDEAHMASIIYLFSHFLPTFKVIRHYGMPIIKSLWDVNTQGAEHSDLQVERLGCVTNKLAQKTISTLFLLCCLSQGG
jgi:hypothetical protein